MAVTYATHEINWETALRDMVTLNDGEEYKGYLIGGSILKITWCDGELQTYIEYGDDQRPKIIKVEVVEVNGEKNFRRVSVYKIMGEHKSFLFETMVKLS